MASTAFPKKMLPASGKIVCDYHLVSLYASHVMLDDHKSDQGDLHMQSEPNYIILWATNQVLT